MNFIRKHWKLLFFAVLVVIGVVAYLNYFSWLKWGLGCQPDPWPEVVIDSWTEPMVDHGWKPASPDKPDGIPGDKLPPVEEAEVILHGSGTVETASGPVEVKIVGAQTPDGKRWLSGWVDGRQIVFDRLEWPQYPARDDRSDFSLLITSEWVDGGPDFGVGVAWQPIRIAGADLGPAVTVDLNRDLLDSPDWITLSGRLSRSWGPVSFGGNLGYALGESSGLRAGLSAGLTVGL